MYAISLKRTLATLTYRPGIGMNKEADTRLRADGDGVCDEQPPWTT